MAGGHRLRLVIAGRQHRLVVGQPPPPRLSPGPRAFLAPPPGLRPAIFDRPVLTSRSCRGGRFQQAIVCGHGHAYASLRAEPGGGASDSATGTQAQTGEISPIRLSQRQGKGRVTYLVDVHDGESAQTAATHHDGCGGDKPEDDRFAIESAGGALVQLFYKIFLPTDFPASVTTNYLRFTSAMILQIFFSNVSRVLATQAMLLALGFGSQVALPFAVVTAWILKDGLGHLGAIAVGTVINKRFDSDPKRYRFQAAAIGKVADVLSIFTLGWPHYFLALSTLGSTCGRISAGTALNCRARIYETFARDSNLGDVMRCAQAQSTAAQLLGTGVGVLLGPLIGGEMFCLLAVNSAFSAASLLSSFAASSEVRMTSLNLQRAELVFHRAILDILSSESSPHGRQSSELVAPLIDNPAASTPGSAELRVPSTQEVQAAEVFVSAYRSVFTVPIVVNPPMRARRLLLTRAASLRAASHALAVEPGTDGQAETVALWIRERASAPDVLRGFFHACVLRSLLAAPAPDRPPLPEIHSRSERVLESWWPRVRPALVAGGWRIDVAFLDTNEGRFSIS